MPHCPVFAGLFMSIPKTQHQNMQGGEGQEEGALEGEDGRGSKGGVGGCESK